MIKQLALVIILVLGIGVAVFGIQQVTKLKSFGYDVLDFVYSFHATTGDPRYNPNMDVNGDGTINVFDVLKDRYAQEATRAGTVASGSAELQGIIDELNEASDEASPSGFYEVD